MYVHQHHATAVGIYTGRRSVWCTHQRRPQKEQEARIIFQETKRTCVGDTPASLSAAAMVLLWDVPFGAVSVALLPLCPTADPLETRRGVCASEGRGGVGRLLLRNIGLGIFNSKCANPAWRLGIIPCSKHWTLLCNTYYTRVSSFTACASEGRGVGRLLFIVISV